MLKRRGRQEERDSSKFNYLEKTVHDVIVWFNRETQSGGRVSGNVAGENSYAQVEMTGVGGNKAR